MRRNKKVFTIAASLAAVFMLLILAVINKADAALPGEKSTPQVIRVEIDKDSENYTVKKLELVNASKDYDPISFQSYKETYNGRVVSFKDETLGYFSVGSMDLEICRDGVNPKTGEMVGGCEPVSKGRLTTGLPFFPNGKTAEIYDPEGKKIVTIDLQSVAQCNENKTCDNSENYDNCPSDCQNKPVSDLKEIPTVTTPATTKSNGLSIADYALISLAIVVVAGAAFWLIRKKKQKNEPLY